MSSNTFVVIHFRLNNVFIKNTFFDVDGFSYIFDSVAIKSLVICSLEKLKATVNARNNRITLGLYDLESPTRHQISPLAYGSIRREKVRDLSGIGSLLSASSRIQSSCHWIFRLWSFLHQPSRTKCSDTSCWGEGFHDGDEQEQIRLETMHKITNLFQDNTHRTPEITWKTQIEKNHRVNRESIIIENYKEKKKTLQPLQ